MSAVQLRLPANMWRQLREVGGNTSPNYVVISALLEYRAHGEAPAMLGFGGGMESGTADVPAELVRWLHAEAALRGKTAAQLWFSALASFLSRCVSPALKAEQVATLAPGRESA